MSINVAEISRIIQDEIANYGKAVDVQETGTVLTVGDGIARLHGLDKAMAGELLEFPHGVRGMVLNLEEDNVGAALFGDDRGIKEGDTVKRTGKTVEIDFQVDPTLIGGMVAQVGDISYDASVRARLEDLQSSLIRNPGAVAEA